MQDPECYQYSTDLASEISLKEDRHSHRFSTINDSLAQKEFEAKAIAHRVSLPFSGWIVIGPSTYGDSRARVEDIYRYSIVWPDLYRTLKVNFN